MAIFNSPFGPEVFVATDKLSEGVDLHGCCRHLMHYELDPSPIRTVQRNGRVRRVGSWSALKKEPIFIAYPALGGTRDQRLVEIMRQRLVQFDLLFGGANVSIETETTDEKLDRQKKALSVAQGRLSRLSLAVVKR